MFCRKAPVLALVLLIAIMLSGPVKAATMAVEDSYLHYSLTNCYLPGDGSVESNTIQVYWTADPPASFSVFHARIIYAMDYLEYSGYELCPGISATVIIGPIWGTNQINIELQNISGLPSPINANEPVNVIMIKFKAKVCLAENSSFSTQFVPNDLPNQIYYNYLTAGGYEWAPPNLNLHNGTINIANYTADFSLYTPGISYLGDTATITVTAMTDFKMYGPNNVIVFATNRLTYYPDGFEYNQDIFPNGFQNGYGVPHIDPLNANHLIVDLRHPTWAETPYTPPILNETWIYKVKFRVTSTTVPFQSDITFDNTAKPLPYASFMSPPFCSDIWSDPIGFHPGTITVQSYTATVKAVPDYSLPDRQLVGKEGPHRAYGYFDIQMLQNFPAGNPFIQPEAGLGNFWVNFSTANNQYDEQNSYIVEVAQPDRKFHLGKVASDANFIMTYANYGDATYPHWVGPQSEFYTHYLLKLAFNSAAYTISSYESRNNLLLDITGATPPPPLMNYPTAIKDVTSYISVTPTMIDATAEVAVAEFKAYGADVYPGSYFSVPIRLRNNFDITDCGVTVSVNRNFVITGYYSLNSKFNVSYASGTYTFTLKSGEVIQNNGNNNTLVAIMSMRTPLCSNPAKPMPEEVGKGSQSSPGPGYVTATVSLTNVYAKDTYNSTQYNQYCLGKAAGLAGKCIGGGVDPEDPIEDEISFNTGLEKGGLPTSFALHQNGPNPFNPETKLAYDVPATAKVKIVVYNILGQQVATLVDETKTAGCYEAYWRGIDDHGQKVSSGIYLAIMQAGKYSGTIKMSLLK